MISTSSIRIVAIGDSITKGDILHSGIKGHENNVEGGWLARLGGKLGSDMLGKFDIINQGLNGDTSHGVLKRVKRDVVAYSPDIVIVAIGTNDQYLEGIHFKDIFRSRSVVTAEAYRKNMVGIIDKIKQGLEGANIIVVGMSTPLKAYWEQSSRSHSVTLPTQEVLDQRFLKANQVLQDLQADYQYAYVDIANAWPSSIDESWALSSDGIHPNDAGYDLITHHVHKVLLGIDR